MEPMDVMEFGRMAVLADPTGAVVGIWQAGTHTGVNLANEPGTFFWAEGLSSDLAAARAFYGAVFGYEYEDLSAPGFEYVTTNIGGRPVGGLGGTGSQPEGAPPHWQVYFAVADTDSSAAQAVALGGTILDGPRDTTYGRLAVVQGPAGEQFALMSTAEPESPDKSGPAGA